MDKQPNMKMANDISFKKFTIQTIVDPATFYVVEDGKEFRHETKFCISPRDVKTFKPFKDLSVGEIVAVKCEGSFHRGLITDIYNKSLKPIYHVWLIDIGDNVEISADSLYILKTSALSNRKLNVTEVIVHGIQPVTIELLVSSVDLSGNVNDNNLNGILHKRESNNWYPAAFKFVKDLFNIDKHIYVKCIDQNGTTIIGDVYYKQEGIGLISLAQTLCDNGFAVFSKSVLEMSQFCDYQDDRYAHSIERRIPSIPRNLDWKKLSNIDSVHITTRHQTRSDNLFSCSQFDKTSSSASNEFLNSSEQKALETKSLSPSWILKKMGKCTQSTSSESFKSSCKNINQTEKAVSSPKVCLMRIVKRNVELYDNRKLKF